MEGISKLDKFTLPFQLLGLQNFRLNDYTSSSETRRFSYFYCFPIVFWIAYGVLIAFGVFGSEFFVSEDEKNFINTVIIDILCLNYVTVIFFAVGFTCWDHSKLEEFFAKFRKVSKLCDDNLKINSLARKLVVPYGIVSLVTLKDIFVIVENFEGPNKAYQLTIVVIYARFMLLRFNFYVQVVNFLLETLIEKIGKSDGKDDTMVQKVLEIRSQNSNNYKNCDELREVYKVIKAMEKIVNDTMGLLITIQIIVVSLEMINFGQSLKNLDWDDRMIWSKLNLASMNS
jgi:hypothetical protein